MRSLFGREVELGAIERLLDATRHGESAAVVLLGEPGIGKTALLAETLRRARKRGYCALGGRAVEIERDLPFALFADALEDEPGSLRRTYEDEFDELEWALLASVFGSLGRSSAKSTATPEFEPDERHRLLSAIHRLLALLSRERPVVLALDDLHWADPASIDLLCRLLHRGVGGSSLLLLAWRPAQGERRLRRAFEEAERHGQARRIEPAPLSVAEGEQLLGAEIEPQLREAIYRESGGNPFYLEQLLGLARRGMAPSGKRGDFGEMGVPVAVNAAIQGEIDRLTGPARGLLTGAALLGEPFEPGSAAETAGVEETAVPDALDELLEADLIRPADTPRRFGFRHPIVRQAVYESAGAGWRLGAHARAAAMLEARKASASERAPHLERSARVGEHAAVDVLAQAGREAMLRAPESAAHWFDAALRLTPEREDNLELRLGLLAQRAATLGSAGRIEQSREALEELLELAPRSSELRHEATILAAILDEMLGSHRAGRELLRRQLSELDHQQTPEAADLMREVSFTHFMDADWQATAHWAMQSLNAECEGMTKVGALAALALAELGLGRLEQVRRSVSEAADLFDSLTDAEIAAGHPGMAIWLGWAEVCTERFADAIRHPERSIAISRSIGQRHTSVGMLAVQGQALALSGDGHALEAVAEAAIEASLLSSSDLFSSWAMALRCHTCLWKGELHEAVRFGERGIAAAGAASSPQAGIARVLLASALLEAGEPERSRELLISPKGLPKLPPFPFHEALCYELLARGEIALGRLDCAEDFVVHAEQAARQVGLQLPSAQARRSRALVLLARGESEAAVAEAEVSWRIAEQAEAPVEAGRSRTLAGVALASFGDRDGAISALESARAQLLDCDALRHADEAARELRKLGCTVTGVSGGRQSNPCALGLSQRESEVMEQVSAGRTNREIAETLFLSVRTVDRHVSRIFDKLDVSSRAAASSAFERARAARLVELPRGR